MIWKLRITKTQTQDQKRITQGKGVENLNMKYGVNKYDTQFTSTGKKKKYFMHDMQKLAVDVTFT